MFEAAEHEGRAQGNSAPAPDATETALETPVHRFRLPRRTGDESHPRPWLHSLCEGVSPGGRDLKRHPTKRARCWIVEVAHS